MRFKSSKCPRMEKSVILLLNSKTTKKGNNSAEDWLRAVGYSEEEITRKHLELLMEQILGGRSTLSQKLLEKLSRLKVEIIGKQRKR
jgi:hypothetical protein